jgi:LPXTG-site transpeptidase (sortase) family protein
MSTRRDKRISKKNRLKSIIRTFIILFILIVAFYFIYGWYKENKIRTVKNMESDTIKLSEKIKSTFDNEIENTDTNENQNTNENKGENLIEPVPSEYLGYEVSAKLEIPKLNINSSVLKEYSKEGLEICVSKFWGPEPNEIGNYCIAGHNYGRKNMFGYLGDLEIGDKIYLSDNKNGKFSYTIYEKYRVEADNVTPISQATNIREITLITCSSYSNKRLIIKACED